MLFSCRRRSLLCFVASLGGGLPRRPQHGPHRVHPGVTRRAVAAGSVHLFENRAGFDKSEFTAAMFTDIILCKLRERAR